MQVGESTSDGVKSASFWQKQRDAKSTAQVATCPICSIFWKPLYQSGKWSSRRNKPYLYSNLLRRNPHCQAHKRFIELGKARSYRKLVRRYCDAIKQGTDQKNPKVWKPRWPSRGYRDCCVSPALHWPDDRTCLDSNRGPSVPLLPSTG